MSPLCWQRLDWHMIWVILLSGIRERQRWRRGFVAIWLPPVAHEFDEESGRIFNDFMNFDGNSQTLRLVTRLQIINDNYGLNLTYASLAAMIKYPQSSYIKNKKWSKHGYLFSEEKVVHDIWQETGLSEGLRHPFTYLMEACDDIAYSILDAEDTIKKG